MRFSTSVAALAAIAPLANAHGIAGMPSIAGLHKDLKARDLLSTLAARFSQVEHAHHEADVLQTRQNNDKRCGDGLGSCGPGECCSRSNFCGTGDSYCYSPGCKYQDGPGCPENQTPKGKDTSSIPRPKLGKVAYGGTGIYHCVTPGTVALTYDDGPQKVLTSHILDLLKKYKAQATFFITGHNINKGQIDTTEEYVNVIRRMDAEGHQIASHTWTHLDLGKISSIDRKNQMYKLEMALRNIVGKIPTYMRPPYSSCTGECEKDMADLGYHVTYFSVDTDDYNQWKVEDIQKSKDWFKGNITKNGNQKSDKWLTVNHDIVEQTANNLTEFMLSTLTEAGYKAVTVGECLGDPKAFWYRNGDGSATVYNEKEENEKNPGNNSTSPGGQNQTNPNSNNQTNDGNNSTNNNNNQNPGNRNPNGGGGATEGNQTNSTGGQQNNNQQGAASSQRGYVTGVVSVAALVVMGVMMV